MNNLNQKTISQWDALEVEHLKQLELLQKKSVAADAKRGEMLLQMEDRGDEAFKEDLKAIDQEREEIALQIEVIKLQLKAIPRLRELARADEIDREIGAVLELDQKLIELAPRIDLSAEAFVQVVAEFYSVVNLLVKKNRWAFSNMRSADYGMLETIGFFLRQFGLWGWLKVGPFRDARSMTASLEKNLARREIFGLVSRMRVVAGRLRGEDIDGREICPKCFGSIQFMLGDNFKHCASCGWRAEKPDQVR